jgi:hypothetical protein
MQVLALKTRIEKKYELLLSAGSREEREATRRKMQQEINDETSRLARRQARIAKWVRILR